VEEDLILYSGRIEELQNKLKEEHTIPIDLTWGPLDLVLVDRLSLSQIDYELLQDQDELERNTASTGPLLATLFVQASDKKKCSVCDVMNPLTAIKCGACTSKFSLECCQVKGSGRVIRPSLLLTPLGRGKQGRYNSSWAVSLHSF
jgi:hypothetical protein